MYKSLRILLWFLFAALATGSAPLWATPHQLTQTPEEELNTAISYLRDPSGELTLEQIRNDTLNWKANTGNAFSQGYNSSAWWLRLRIHNPEPAAQKRMLELGYAVLDYVDIYVVSDNQVIAAYHTGDERKYHSRPIDHRFFVAPLDWAPGETLQIYYRLKSSSALQAPLNLWTPTAFYNHEADSNILQGLYYGAMAGFIIYNLLIFIVLRDKSYLYYVGFVFSSLLFFLAISGQGYRYIWTDLIAVNALSIPVSLSGLILFGALFTRSFIGLKNVSRMLDRMILTFVVLGAILLVISLLFPYQVSISLLVPVALFACPADLLAGSISWYRGITAARFYVIAWSCFLLATVVMALQKIDLLPNHVLVDYAVQLGSALEAVLLSFALAERINTERRLRFRAQEETIDTAQRLNAELEKRVEERTEELETLNQRLQILSNTDQLTGLYNRRHLEHAGEKEWLRCRRYSHSLAVLILDADYFKDINDRYGHPAGDICLQQIAAQLKSSLRPPLDTISRYGGEEFCILLPETDAKSAVSVAERLRSEIESMSINAGDFVFKVTVSIGVYSAVPTATTSMEDALKYADQALYLSKNGGRNRVSLYNPESSVTPFQRNH